MLAALLFSLPFSPLQADLGQPIEAPEDKQPAVDSETKDVPQFKLRTARELYQMALHDLVQGDAAGARLDLSTQAGQFASDKDARLLERTQVRIVAFEHARDALVRARLTDGKSLRLVLDGKETSVKLASMEGQTVTLAKPKKGITEFKVNDLGVAAVHANLKRDRPEGVEAWVAAFTGALARDPKWSKGLKGLAEADDLKADLSSVEADLVLGAALRGLESLSHLFEPPASISPELLGYELETLRRIVPAFDREPDLVLHRPLLRDLAQRMFELEAEPLPLEHLLAGELRWLEDGRVRIEYDLSSAAQAADFVTNRDWFDHFRTYDMRDLPDSSHEVRDGSLWLMGREMLRHVVELGPPLRVEASVQYAYDVEDPPEFVGGVVVGVIHYTEVRRQSIYSQSLSELYFADPMQDIERELNVSAFNPVDAERTYDLGLKHDGSQVRRKTYLGEEVELEAGEFQGGHPFVLATTSHPMRISDLAFEGTLLPGAREAAASIWVQRQLGELGL